MLPFVAASAVYSYLPSAGLARASGSVAQQLRSRPAVLSAPTDAPVDGEATEAPTETVGDLADMEGSVKPTRSKQAELNRQLAQAEDSGEVLQIVEQNAADLNAVNIATALHRIASRNKKKRARRDAVLQDSRFNLLITALEVQCADGMANAPRSVADVLWSFGTLQHWPPSLLKPMLMSVLGQLEKGTFEPQHLSTVVWAFAKLETKPVRLLEQIEEQATESVAKLTMQARRTPPPRSPTAHPTAKAAHRDRPSLLSDRHTHEPPMPHAHPPARLPSQNAAEHRQPSLGLRQAQLRAQEAPANARAGARDVGAVRDGQAGRGGRHHICARLRCLERAGGALGPARSARVRPRPSREGFEPTFACLPAESPAFRSHHPCSPRATAPPNLAGRRRRRARAAPGAALDDFSSRQLATMVTSFAKLDATESLPEGVLDAWLAVRHAAMLPVPRPACPLAPGPWPRSGSLQT